MPASHASFAALSSAAVTPSAECWGEDSVMEADGSKVGIGNDWLESRTWYEVTSEATLYRSKAFWNSKIT